MKSLLSALTVVILTACSFPAHGQYLIDILSGAAITGPNLTGDFANTVGTSGGSNLTGTSGAYQYDSATNTITPLADETATGGTGTGQGAALTGTGQMIKSNNGDTGYLDFGSDWQSLLVEETFTSYLGQTSSTFGPGGPLFASAYWTDDVTPGTTDYLEDLGSAGINFGLTGKFSTGTAHEWFLSGNYASDPSGGIAPDGEYLVYRLGTFNTATTSTRMDGLAIVGAIRPSPEPSTLALLLAGCGLAFLFLHRSKRLRPFREDTAGRDNKPV